MLAPGDLVAGKYRIERLLGEGGMGAVFVAVNERLRKPVALKILRPDAARSPVAAERFTREAIAASSAKHPGVIEIYDADVHDGLPWIAMELLEGETLGARVQRGPLPLDEVLEIACQALAALAHVHRAGILHRDLKPDNLFLEALPDGGRRVKILDFGIAASSSAELVRVTQTGIAVGTPAYFAPEQAAGMRDLDERVDVYAMGVILFELITGRLPYTAESIGEMVMRMFTVGPPSLAREAPHVPAELSALIDGCLAIERDARVPSADALRRGLEGLRSRVAGLASAPSTREIAILGGRSPEPGVTPIGHPSFGVAPRAHTPEAFAQTVYAQATPSAAPAPIAKPATSRSRVVALAVALGLLLLGALAAVGIGVAVMQPAEAPTEIATATAVAPPPVLPVPVAPEVPAMMPLEPTPAEAQPVEVTPPVEPAAAAPPRRPRVERRQPPRAPASPSPPPPEPQEEPPRPLDNATIVRVLEANEEALDRCYFDAYPERPRPRVRTEVDLTISRDGRVTESSVVGGPRPLLGACAQRVLSRVRFPAHPHSTRARFPMTFHDEQ